MAEQDPYDIPGVDRDATEKEIDKLYRRLARKYHPDVKPGDKQAEEQFKKIAAAHELLSSPEKRKLYDEFVVEARKIGFDPEKARAYRVPAAGGPARRLLDVIGSARSRAVRVNDASILERTERKESRAYVNRFDALVLLPSQCFRARLCGPTCFRDP